MSLEPYAKRLILVEKGIGRESLAGFASDLDRPDDETLVVVVDQQARLVFSDAGFAVMGIDEYIPQQGVFGRQLWSESEKMLDRAVCAEPLAGLVRQAQWDGLCLWKAARYGEIKQTIFPLIRCLHALKMALASGQWQQVDILVNDGVLKKLFGMVAGDSGFDGQVREIPMADVPSREGPGRRLARRFAHGWASQLRVDWCDGLRPGRKVRTTCRCQTPDVPLYMFVVGGRTSVHPAVMLPVMEEMTTRGRVLLLSDGGIGRAAKTYEEHGIEIAYWSQFVPWHKLPQIAKRGWKLRALWTALVRDYGAEAIFEHDGKLLWPVLRRWLEVLVVERFAKMVFWAEAAKNIYRSMRPSAVVVSPETPAPIVAIALARRYGIPSLFVHTGLTDDSPRHGHVEADMAAVISPYCREVCMRRGVAPDRLVIAGLTCWDGIARREVPHTAQTVREQLNIAPEDKIVIFGTQPLPVAETRRMVEPVFRAVSRLANVRLVIKVHPRELVEKYATLVADIAMPQVDPVIVRREVDLHSLIAASELLLTGFSNVALEAAILGKSVVAINLRDEPDILPFVADGIAADAGNEAEIEEQVVCLVSDPEAKKELTASRDAYFHRNPELRDGRAAQRLAQLITEMARGPDIA